MLRLRELGLAQQARTVRRALEYEGQRQPAARLTDAAARVVQGMMLVSQVRQRSDRAFERHFTAAGRLAARASGATATATALRPSRRRRAWSTPVLLLLLLRHVDAPD